MIESLREVTRAVLTNPIFLVVWGALVAASLAILLRDLKKNNREIVGLMKLVWGFTVLSSGPLGLFLYWATGRKQILRDSLWRKGARSTAHCYSGCGIGEVTGVFIAGGLLSLGNWWIAGVTFALAYVFGFAMTVGPLVQEGVGWSQALKDAFYSETASITAMELAAIGSDLWLARNARMGEMLFWSSLVFSLSMGLLAAYPVNVLLIRWGIKQGMHSPKEMAA
jgi:Domain of unknown function (DUF4396)